MGVLGIFCLANQRQSRQKYPGNSRAVTPPGRLKRSLHRIARPLCGTSKGSTISHSVAAFMRMPHAD